ncbi:MAG TPA: DUF418 domain-containing protein [Steroidobacteraceae bacterium]|nr:DUF418 domain-containing protein [Steroidobacteraceae bacterium]
MSNLAYLSLYEFLDATARGSLISSNFDAIATPIMEWVVNGKFITIFSLLFGLGFSLQIQRATLSGGAHLWQYLRRILVLMFMGWIHSWFIWWGDILLTYAVIGLLMIPFRHVSDRVLLICGVTIAVLPSLIGTYVRALLTTPPDDTVVYARALHGFSSGNLGDALSANIATAKWARANWPLVFFILARFLLGYWAGRKDLFFATEQNYRTLRRIFYGALALSLAATTCSYVQSKIIAAYPAISTGTFKVLIRMMLRAGPLAIGIAYAVGFVLLFNRPAWASRLRVLVPFGRMALTNYLTQSLIGIVLFYGVGIGIGPRFGMISVCVACALTVALQIWWSQVWLSHFTQGPLEWVWRWLTYGRRPQFRMDKGTIGSINRH